MSDYLQLVQQSLTQIAIEEKQTMQQAAQLIYKSLREGGILQLFGSGHSQILAQEVYYRAGGLVPVKPISIEALMLHQGAVVSSFNEKDMSQIEEYWMQIDLQPHDVLVVISTSGRNVVPVEIAKRAQQQGITVVTLQSLYYENQPSTHPSGNRLESYADLVLNTHVPVGDGILREGDLQFGPVSTMNGAAILNEVITQVIKHLIEAGETVPVFGSSNVVGAGQSNEQLMEQYKHRIEF